MEIFKKPFVQVTVPPFEKQNSQNKIKAEKLLNLIEDEKIKNAIINHHGLSSLDFHIQVDNVDLCYKYVEYITSKYEYLNLKSVNNKVTTFVAQSQESDKKQELFFDFDTLFDEDGVAYSSLRAKAEYDSVSMFYKDRELSKYINYLKSSNARSIGNLKDRNILIEDVNNSWKKQYERNPLTQSERKFRFLKDKNGNYFLRSITSDSYYEYGIAFSFVISILSLHKMMVKEKGVNFSISSLSLNESKFDMVISTGNPLYVKEIDNYITSSILIKNNDLGDRSLSFTHSLKLTPLQNDERKILLFPKFNDKEIKYKMSASHSTGIKKVLKTFDNIESVIYLVDDYVKDFKGFVKTKSPDELRAKIEEKVISNNSPFKGITELKKLFERSASQHIDNLAKLLEICQKAEMVDMDYDLKFKLRYIISNTLLYGKNNY